MPPEHPSLITIRILHSYTEGNSQLLREMNNIGPNETFGVFWDMRDLSNCDTFELQSTPLTAMLSTSLGASYSIMARRNYVAKYDDNFETDRRSAIIHISPNSHAPVYYYIPPPHYTHIYTHTTLLTFYISSNLFVLLLEGLGLWVASKSTLVSL